jgi:hypothetical protein
MLPWADASGPGGGASPRKSVEDERTRPADPGAARGGAPPTPEGRVERFRILQTEVMARHEERLLPMAQLAAAKAERKNRLKARLENLEGRIEAVRGAEGVDGGALKRLREEAERLRAGRAQDDGVRTAERSGRAAGVHDRAHQTDEERRARFDVLQADVMERHRERVLRMAKLAAGKAERDRGRRRAADTGAPRGAETAEANRERAGAEETRAAQDAQRRLAEAAERMRRAAEGARAQRWRSREGGRPKSRHRRSSGGKERRREHGCRRRRPRECGRPKSGRRRPNGGGERRRTHGPQKTVGRRVSDSWRPCDS